MTVVFTIVFVIVLYIYSKSFVKVVRQDINYRFYRRGKLIREGRNGTLIVMIPLLDSLELSDERPDLNKRERIKGFVNTVPPNVCYIHYRKGKPIRKLCDEQRVFLIPGLDWLEIQD